MPVTRNDWEKLANEARSRAVMAVTYAASNTITHAKVRSRVDTSSMRNGWKSRSADGGLQATIYNEMHYAIWNEIGTSRMTAQPMLQPGLDAVQDTFEVMLNQIVKPGLA
jgi:HK97 gp10 family phage protein